MVEKAVSLGYGGILVNEIKSVFYGKPKTPKINGFILGLGGRDVTVDTIHQVIKETTKAASEEKFVGLNEALIEVNSSASIPPTRGNVIELRECVFPRQSPKG